MREYLDEGERTVASVAGTEPIRSIGRARRLGIAVTDRRVFLVRCERPSGARKAPHEPTELIATVRRADVEVLSFAHEYQWYGQYGATTTLARLKLRLHDDTLKLDAASDQDAYRVAHELSGYRAAELDAVSRRRRVIGWIAFVAPVVALLVLLSALGVINSDGDNSSDPDTPSVTFSQELVEQLPEKFQRQMNRLVVVTTAPNRPTTSTRAPRP